MTTIIDHLNSTGVQINIPALEKLLTEAKQMVTSTADEITQILGESIDVDSPQFAFALFRYGLNPTSMTMEYFKMNRIEHPLYNLIYQYKKRSANCTYLKNLREMIAPNGRLYGKWVENSCLSGRMTCLQPNLQALPLNIRDCIIPKEGYSIIKADYSQIELRILAEMSQDKNLIQCFCDGGDIHAQTASILFNKPQSEINEQERQAAKKVNFGIVYGISAFGLQEQLKNTISLTVSQCTTIRNNFYKGYPKVLSFQDSLLRSPKVYSIGGQHWYNDGLRPTQSLNIPIQSTGAEILKMALLLLFKQLRNKWSIINTIHDEIWIEIPKDQVKDAEEVLIEGMNSAFCKYIHSLPFKADTIILNNEGDK